MKIKFLYISAFLAFALVIIFSVSFFVVGAGIPFLWHIFLPSQEFPATGYGWLFLFDIIFFVMVMVIALRSALKKVRQASSGDSKKAHQKAATFFFQSMGVFLVFSLYLSWFGFSGNQTAVSAPRAIEKVLLSQKENGFEVAIIVPGPSDDKYDLMLQLESTGYTQAKIIEFVQPAPLNYPQQIFTFDISFEQLEQEYSKIIRDYIPTPNQKIVIDEDIQVKAQLALHSAPKNSFDVNKKSGSGLQSYAVAKFSFSCFENSCKVIQEKPNAP